MAVTKSKLEEKAEQMLTPYDSELGFDPKALTDSIIMFGKELTKVKLYSYQEEFIFRIIYSIVTKEGETITILISRQAGKSQGVAFIACTLCVIMPVLAKIIPAFAEYTDGFFIGLFAPQSDQVKTTYDRALGMLKSDNANAIMSDSEINTGLLYEVRLNLTNGSYLAGQTASKTSKIESKTYHLLLLEESQHLDDNLVATSIEPMATACLMEGQFVTTEGGFFKKAEDVLIGDTLVGFNEESRLIDTGIVNWVQPTSEKECFEITLHTGRNILCSYDHPILTRERKGGAYGRKLLWKETSTLCVGNHVAVADAVDYWGTEKMWSPRLVGYLIGDGTYGHDTSPRLATCDEEIRQYAYTTQDCCSSKTTERFTKEGKFYNEIRIRGICPELRKLGIYKQVKLNKRLPKDYTKYCKEDLANLLGGFFDTDGYVTIKDNRNVTIGLSTAVFELLKEVQLLLQKFGVHSMISFSKGRETDYGRNGCFVLTISDKRSVLNFKKNIEFTVKYKQDKLDLAESIFIDHKEKIDVNYQTLRFERIVKITSLGLKKVYNFEVDKIHTYLANGIVTHNTNGTIVKVGTTSTRKGDFFNEIQRNIIRSQKIKDKRLGFHFEYAYREVMKRKREQYNIDGNKFHLNYEKFINLQIAKRGTTDDSFKIAYALTWSFEGGMFITDGEWNSLLNKRRGFTRTIDPNWDVVAGMDIAKENASTVICICKRVKDEKSEFYKAQIIQIIELEGMNYEMQHVAIVQALADYNINTFYADYTGVGKPVVDRLISSCGNYVQIMPYTFSRPSKSEMWQALRGAIDNNRLEVPASDNARQTTEYIKLEQQMKAMIKYYEGGYLVANKPDRYGYDDYCDALGLAIMAVNTERVTQKMIEVSSDNPFFSRGGVSVYEAAW